MTDSATLSVNPDDLSRKLFLEGAAGTGKTTYAVNHLRAWLESGISPDQILILVPQITLARPYQLALHQWEFNGGAPHILTLAGFARQAVSAYWSAIADQYGFDPDREPTFLNIETAQYFMARFALPRIHEGQFSISEVSVATPRIISQVIDNLNRAALMRFPLDDVAARLINAWGSRTSNRKAIYERVRDLAAEFREHCVQNNLLDFSLTIELFHESILPRADFAEFMADRFAYLLADNIEEDTPASHDFVAWLLPALRGALIIYDNDGGVRTFLGADPDYAYSTLRELCDNHGELTQSRVMSPAVNAFGAALNRIIGTRHDPSMQADADPRMAFQWQINRFYPQMIEWVADKITELIAQNVPARQIAVVSPYVGDSLRFTLGDLLRKRGINLFTHRPSRALNDDPVTRALLTLTLIAHPEWIDGENVQAPPKKDVADTLALVVGGLDPLRARLLTEIVYQTKRGENGHTIPTLSTFARIKPDMQARISYTCGARYDQLREWLESYRAQLEYEGGVPLDHFLRRLFGEVLAQPNFGFFADLESGRVAAQLIASAQAFRKALFPGAEQDWTQAGREYLSLVSQRLLPALFAQNWEEEEADAVFLTPISTFLLRNRVVDYQFWLDIGGSGWSERIEQPLTHPYVLRRTYQADQMWTDEHETEVQNAALYRNTIGLLRRCRKQVYLGVADLNEGGFEGRGLLLKVLNQVLRRADGATSGEQDQ